MPPDNAPLFLCTVGGSPAPIIHSLSIHRPDRVLFICSASSASSVAEQILPALEKVPACRCLSLTDEQDLLSCVRDIRAGLDGTLEAWTLAKDSALLADFTGGTKVMSASLVMAVMERNVQFTYIGGTQRSKGGLGTVQDGAERVMHLANPWQVLAFPLIRELALAFNSCQFAEAERLALDIAGRGVHPDLFQTLAGIAKAYALWDGFRPAEALPLLTADRKRLQELALPSLASFAMALADSERGLSSLVAEMEAFSAEASPCPAFLRDLAANALRRERQGRFDDAVARLYSLLEKAAQLALRSDFGLDTGNLSLDDLPPAFTAENHVMPGRTGAVQLPLFKSYELLACLGHPLGLRFQAEKEALDLLLRARNESLLAHGLRPVTQADCASLKKLVLGFLELPEESLAGFPRLSPDDLNLAAARDTSVRSAG